MDTWNTDETARIIANDEGLYDTVVAMERTATSTSELADMMEQGIYDAIHDCPYSDIDMDRIDWHEIATEYITEDEDEPIMCTCDECGTDFKEDDLIRVHYRDGSNSSRQQPYMSPCCHSDYEYIE